jgi:hypothetical protein
MQDVNEPKITTFFKEKEAFLCISHFIEKSSFVNSNIVFIYVMYLVLLNHVMYIWHCFNIECVLLDVTSPTPVEVAPVVKE